MKHRTTLAATTLILLGGCVQTDNIGTYSSVSTVSYGDGQTLTRTQQDQWHNQQQQSPTWQAKVTPLGSSINIQANPPPLLRQVHRVPQHQWLITQHIPCWW